MDYLVANRIVSLTAQTTPQLNGIAEPKNMTLLHLMKSMLSYSIFPLILGYALETTMCHLNRCLELLRNYGQVVTQFATYPYLRYPSTYAKT